MGYRIRYALQDGMLRAAVSGRTLDRGGGACAERIARDIAEQAGRGTVNRVLIDVRGLADRVGSLGALSMARCAPQRAGYRVAVVDALENDAYYALHEMAARALTEQWAAAQESRIRARSVSYEPCRCAYYPRISKPRLRRAIVRESRVRYVALD